MLVIASRNCDFSVDTCGWTQSNEDDFNWSRGTGETETDNTGPTGDHTTADGEQDIHNNLVYTRSYE